MKAILVLRAIKALRMDSIQRRARPRPDCNGFTGKAESLTSPSLAAWS